MPIMIVHDEMTRALCAARVQRRRRKRACAALKEAAAPRDERCRALLRDASKIRDTRTRLRQRVTAIYARCAPAERYAQMLFRCLMRIYHILALLCRFARRKSDVAAASCDLSRLISARSADAQRAADVSLFY